MAANNFGFNIGKGGISDLFKQVEVKPVRGVQFAPTPRLPRETEKDAKKGIQGALLGAISPLLAEASIRGLGRLPGLEGLLYQKSPDVLKELGVEDPTLGTKRQPTLGTRERRRSIEDLAGRQLTDDEYELLEDSSKLRTLGIGEKVLDPFEEEAKKRRAVVDAALPRGRVPRQKTLLGKAFTEALSYAPLAALDEDAIAPGLTTAAATRKSQSAFETANLENFLKRGTKRGELLADIGSFDRGIGNGVVLRAGDATPTTVKRNFAISPDKQTQYIMSQGDPEVDYEYRGVSRVPVPKGQWYTRSDFLLDPEKIKDPEIAKLLVDDVNGKVSHGKIQYSLNEEGLAVPTLFVSDYADGGKYKSVQEMRELYGDNWHTPTPGFAYETRTLRGRQIQPLIDIFEKREITEGALAATIRPLRTLAELSIDAIDSGDFSTFATMGGAQSLIVDFTREVDTAIDTVNDVLGRNNKSISSVLRDKIDLNKAETDEASYALQLYEAQLNYEKALRKGIGTAAGQAEVAKRRTQYRQSLKAFRDNAESLGAGREGIRFMDNILSDLASDKFDETAIRRSRLLSAQLRLAYMSAAQDGNTGVALSDRDVSNYLQRVGYGSKNPNVVLDKVDIIFKETVGDFDRDGTPRELLVSSYKDTPENIRFMDNHIRGYGVGASDLNFIKDMKNSREDRINKASDILVQMGKRTGNLAQSHFYYDPDRGRILLRGVDSILNNKLLTSYQWMLQNVYSRDKFNLNLEEVMNLVPLAPAEATDDKATKDREDLEERLYGGQQQPGTYTP